METKQQKNGQELHYNVTNQGTRMFVKRAFSIIVFVSMLSGIKLAAETHKSVASGNIKMSDQVITMLALSKTLFLQGDHWINRILNSSSGEENTIFYLKQDRDTSVEENVAKFAMKRHANNIEIDTTVTVSSSVQIIEKKGFFSKPLCRKYVAPYGPQEDQNEYTHCTSHYSVDEKNGDTTFTIRSRCRTTIPKDLFKKALAERNNEVAISMPLVMKFAVK